MGGDHAVAPVVLGLIQGLVGEFEEQGNSIGAVVVNGWDSVGDGLGIAFFAGSCGGDLLDPLADLLGAACGLG